MVKWGAAAASIPGKNSSNNNNNSSNNNSSNNSGYDGDDHNDDGQSNKKLRLSTFFETAPFLSGTTEGLSLIFSLSRTLSLSYTHIHPVAHTHARTHAQSLKEVFFPRETKCNNKMVENCRITENFPRTKRIIQGSLKNHSLVHQLSSKETDVYLNSLIPV